MKECRSGRDYGIIKMVRPTCTLILRLSCILTLFYGTSLWLNNVYKIFSKAGLKVVKERSEECPGWCFTQHLPWFCVSRDPVRRPLLGSALQQHLRFGRDSVWLSRLLGFSNCTLFAKIVWMLLSRWVKLKLVAYISFPRSLIPLKLKSVKSLGKQCHLRHWYSLWGIKAET